ncbi:MAG: hypothetical protein HC850_08745 [Rhodomicrobium sp.]|nr:hypothetical protein [Rhodomicrobium sp.]
MTSIFQRSSLACSAALGLAIAAQPAWAVLIVEKSDAPGIEIDAQLPDDYVFDVPPGATVNLIKKPGNNPAGDTHLIKGRYKGTLDDYIERECWRAESRCDEDTGTAGGVRGMIKSPGGVKGLAPKE